MYRDGSSDSDMHVCSSMCARRSGWNYCNHIMIISLSLFISACVCVCLKHVFRDGVNILFRILYDSIGFMNTYYSCKMVL